MLKMFHARAISDLLPFFIAFFVALIVVGFGAVILGIYEIDRSNRGVVPVFILMGLPLILVVTLDLIDRIVAFKRFARLLEGFNADDIEHIIHALTGASTSFMAPRTRFEPKWHRLIEFLNSDHFGRIATQTLFQSSHEGRIRYFKQAARIARLHFPGRPHR